MYFHLYYRKFIQKLPLKPFEKNIENNEMQVSLLFFLYFW